MIWRTNMNYNYNNLTPKTRKAINAAIDMRLNGKQNSMSLGESKNIDCCTLLLAIIETDNELQTFLNELNPKLIDRLKSKIDTINNTKTGFFGAKSSENYSKDYSDFKFGYLLSDVFSYINKYAINYQERHKDRIININFLSPNLIAWSLMADNSIINIFAELEDNPKVNRIVSEDQNSYFTRLIDFLYSRIVQEESLSYTLKPVVTDIKTSNVVNQKERFQSNNTVSYNVPTQNQERKTATANSASTSFNYQTAEAKERTEGVMNNPENIKKMLASIEQKFIGQENAAKLLFFNIIKNQKLASIPNIPSGTRSVMFIDGPSGTGKTAITKDITDNLGLPFVATSITNYSASGYVGGNITDILKELYVKSGGDLSKAERGIVVLDELDKIVNNSSRDLTMKTAVQHQLLDFLGGGKYTIEVDKGQTVEFDTSKLTFVCLGALTNLRNDKMQMSSSRPIGFNVKYDESTKAKDYSITPEDLIKMGFEKELVGRFNTYVHTKDYSKSDLKKILLESKISPLIGFKTLVSSFGKKLVIDEDAYDLIAEAAYDLNTGARSLQTVVNNLNSRYLEELLVGAEEEIHITFEDVKRINEAAFKEKGRC